MTDRYLEENVGIGAVYVSMLLQIACDAFFLEDIAGRGVNLLFASDEDEQSHAEWDNLLHRYLAILSFHVV